MSRKPTVDVFQTKTTRNDRFAQMSHQEKIIEQKKKEIQAKLEQKQKNTNNTTTETKTNTKQRSSPKPEIKTYNQFSNDGSFLDQFKQLKDKKMEQKLKSFKTSQDRNHSDEGNKYSRWSHRRRTPSPKPKNKISRFSDKPPPISEQKININTSYTNLISQVNFNMQPVSIPQQNIMGQPLMKSEVISLGLSYSTASQTNESVITAGPVMLNVPPPQIVIAQPQMAPPLDGATMITMNIPPPTVSLLPQLELNSIQPPEPIALNVPPPVPIQVQNIPPPSPIQLNEIPNPKPMDVVNIPTPDTDKLSDPEFIKNVPPPNKSIPPPSLPDLGVPPPNALGLVVHSMPPPQGIPPPTSVTISVVANGLGVLPTPAPAIPSLLAQPVLPPSGMVGVSLPNIHCPPPMVQPITQFVTPPPTMPPLNVPPPTNLPPPNFLKDLTTGTVEYESMRSLGRMVAECGDGIEDCIRQRKPQDANLWFLFHKESAAYRQYRQLVTQFKNEMKQEVKTEDYHPEDLYEPEMAIEEDDRIYPRIKKEEQYDDVSDSNRRKRKSRWGEKDTSLPPPIIARPGFSPVPAPSNLALSKITRNDPGLIQYVFTTYGTSTLNEEDWKKAEENYKINLVYQDMLRRRQEMERLNKIGKHKYEYDSDEEIDGGTWEHKLREKEMCSTHTWASELTKNAEGKHHIGDFLPPDELKKFFETNPPDEFIDNSDYKDFKLKEDNLGFKMLQKLGWSEGQGLGVNTTGILEPVNNKSTSIQNQGLGLVNPTTLDSNDDEYDAYRKRMMLAYRFRPNPLNNPRRPYY